MLQKSSRDDGFVEPTLTEREQAVARLVSLGLPNSSWLRSLAFKWER